MAIASAVMLHFIFSPRIIFSSYLFVFDDLFPLELEMHVSKSNY